jgi:hypothetical protein
VPAWRKTPFICLKCFGCLGAPPSAGPIITSFIMSPVVSLDMTVATFRAQGLDANSILDKAQLRRTIVGMGCDVANHSGKKCKNTSNVRHSHSCQGCSWSDVQQVSYTGRDRGPWIGSVVDKPASGFDYLYGIGVFDKNGKSITEEGAGLSVIQVSFVAPHSLPLSVIAGQHAVTPGIPPTTGVMITTTASVIGFPLAALAKVLVRRALLKPIVCTGAFADVDRGRNNTGCDWATVLDVSVSGQSYDIHYFDTDAKSDYVSDFDSSLCVHSFYF